MFTVLQRRRAFTLIELLLVIGIIAILASIVVVAINPGSKLATSRDAVRRSDMSSIINAIQQYAVDHSGAPNGWNANGCALTAGTYYGICQGGDCSSYDGDSTYTTEDDALSGGTGCAFDFEGALTVPTDPLVANSTVTGTTDFTGYAIKKTSSGTYILSGAYAEGTVGMEVKQ